MLNLNTIVSGLILAFIGWVGMSIVELKTDTAVVKVKVDENHKMLTVLWQDFLKDKTNDNLASFYAATGIKAAAEEKVE